ncbi:unnamed protein product [Ostreobium quekettii]|uniref:SEC7 domain-containing protein n=1 Tax=Ostreobium quekettii TaxID=121088 RepID=A0A8S1IUX2_9CHLO|nr:unnamed protein product [Ostreobium quekettii]
MDYDMNDVQYSLILSNEIATVATALRQNSKWAFVASRYSDEEQLDDPLLEEFLSLRQKVMYWGNWALVDPLEYLSPFLEAIRSQEVSGPITSVALSSLMKLLASNVISPGTTNSAEAIRRIVSSVRECRFEGTGSSADEAVLLRILQVLVAAVRSDVGTLLAARDVQDIFLTMIQWCEVGEGSPGSEVSGVFTQSSRQLLGEMVGALFARLRISRMNELGGSEGCRPRGKGSPMSRSRSANSDASKGNRSVSGHSASKSDVSAGSASASPPLLMFGIEPFWEIFRYLISLASTESRGPGADDVVLFALQLIHTSIVSGGEALADHRGLQCIMRQHLFMALTRALSRGHQSIQSAVFQVVLAMYKLFGDRILLQLECFMQSSLLRLCEGKGCQSQEHQEVALEALLDFCGYPGFLHDMYLNLDCRVERSNLFEDICSLLSKTAFPVKSSLGAIHMISLEGLLAMLYSLSAQCCTDGTTAQLPPEPKAELPHYIDIWGNLLEGRSPGLEVFANEVSTSGREHLDTMVQLIRLEKAIKRRVSVAADHFNKDFKKGFQYMQAMKLLPDKEDCTAIAHFLRVCQNLDKTMIGELLGESGELYKQVLQEFAQSFRFQDVPFDLALRMFLDTFKVGGEAQKIDRAMENFGKVYYKTQVNGLMASSDAAFTLAFSIIMLNTDLHSSGVKKKMTMEEFVRNNRGINDNENFPREFLESLYRSISQNPIRLQDTSAGEVPIVRWLVLDQQSETERGRMLRTNDRELKGGHALDRDMFSLIWGPTVAAVSVVLDQAEDITTVQTALTGLKLAAKIASYYRVDEVIDSLVVTLCKFTMQLAPGASKPLINFGNNTKAQVAMETVFFVASRYGDSLRAAGWRSIMDLVVRLYRLGLLPNTFWQETNGLSEDEDGVRERELLKLASDSDLSSYATSSLSRLFMSGGAEKQLTREEQEAQERTVQCIEHCRIDELFLDTKFLQPEPLLELVRAVTWASGWSPRHTNDEKTSVVCLELMFSVTIRNRDRINKLWPLVHDHLKSVIIPSDRPISKMLVEVGVLGLLRVCQRILVYKPEVADLLLTSLQFVRNLDADMIRDMAEKVATEVLALIKGAASFIHQGWAWSTICLLICLTAASPPAFKTSLDAFVHIVKDGAHLTPVNFSDCLSTARSFVERTATYQPDKAIQVLDLMGDMVVWLPTWKPSQGERRLGYPAPPEKGLDRAQCWSDIIKALCSFSSQESAPQALITREKAWDVEENFQTVKLSVKTLSRTFLQFLHLLQKLPTFSTIWLEMLTVLQKSCYRHNELAESVPEDVKNMLLVMAKEGVLTQEWQDAKGKNLWEATWREAQRISYALTPKILAG